MHLGGWAFALILGNEYMVKLASGDAHQYGCEHAYEISGTNGLVLGGSFILSQPPLFSLSEKKERGCFGS